MFRSPDSKKKRACLELLTGEMLRLQAGESNGLDLRQIDVRLVDHVQAPLHAAHAIAGVGTELRRLVGGQVRRVEHLHRHRLRAVTLRNLMKATSYARCVYVRIFEH